MWRVDSQGGREVRIVKTSAYTVLTEDGERFYRHDGRGVQGVNARLFQDRDEYERRLEYRVALLELRQLIRDTEPRTHDTSTLQHIRALWTGR